MNHTDFFAFQRLALGIGFFEKQDSEKPSASKNADMFLISSRCILRFNTILHNYFGDLQ